MSMSSCAFISKVIYLEAIHGVVFYFGVLDSPHMLVRFRGIRIVNFITIFMSHICRISCLGILSLY